MDIETAAPAATTTSGPSAVSWGAVFAGAAVASAISLLLLVLAAGLNLAAFSLAPLRRGSPVAVTAMAAITLIVTQWVSSGVGGYLTGRLRTRWIDTHTHEVFFRDTAHGFITWAVATLFMALALGSAASSLVGAGLTGTAGTRSPAHRLGTRELVSTAQAQDVPTGEEMQAQLVIPNGPRERPATSLVQDSGMSLTQDPGEDRDASPLTERARKDAAFGSLMTALSMVVGAFIASVAAAVGGRRRDLHP
jgi:hypothetical protein